ncbi:related to uracil permease [Ramularia collo-cygni]|uniref:Related to uracil permease n=1 Tax=Ramularia collo-cygni TaxID=112498 RepID=A0A2D3V9V1_9PEZI|nr:related to uracil permease [Ramularia collo-cygni]CZT23700.1 related to uracil permease [Ramularia collo-cygni]
MYMHFRLQTKDSSRWINEDIRPLPPDRRKWTTRTYIGFWLAWHVSIINVTIGSGLVALGLAVWQVMIAIIVARAIIAAVAILCGYIGADWHIGFPVYSRALWGMYGSYVPVIQRILCGIVGIAVQSYFGGTCIVAILSAIFPSFHRMANSLPASAVVDTKSLIGWILFNLMTIAFVIGRLERTQFVRIFVWLNTYSFLTFLAIMIWTLVRAGGGGQLLSNGSLPNVDVGWGMCQAITTVVGSIAIGLMSQPDFTRFANTSRAQVTGQWTSIMIFGTLMPFIGCVIASATASIYEKPIWNPTELLLQWLADEYSPGSRAAAFFAGLGLLASQLVLNSLENCFSTGIDLACIVPKYLNIRRGALLALAVACTACPWQLLTNASTFLNIVSSYTVVVAPMLGIQICDYWILRKRRVQLSALYDSDPQAAYYYFHGWNWRPILVWIVSWTPQLPGFINAIEPSIQVPIGATRLFQLSFLFGGTLGFCLFYIVNLVFPPGNMGQVDDVDYFATFSSSEWDLMDIKNETALNKHGSDIGKVSNESQEQAGERV